MVARIKWAKPEDAAALGPLLAALYAHDVGGEPLAIGQLDAHARNQPTWHRVLQSARRPPRGRTSLHAN